MKNQLMYVYMFVLILHPFRIHSSGGGAQDLCSKCKIDKIDFAEWMSFQPFIFCKRSILIRKTSLEIPTTSH